LAFVVQTTSAQLTKDLGEFSTIKIYDRLTVSYFHLVKTKLLSQEIGKRSGGSK
jgi:hypothetical protein